MVPDLIGPWWFDGKVGAVFTEQQYYQVKGHDCQQELANHLAYLSAYFGDIPKEGPEKGQFKIETSHLAQEIARLNKTALLADAGAHALRQASPEMALWLDQYRLRTIALNSASLKAADEIHTLLEDAEISHTFFKGPPQQDALYGNPFLRPASDTDVLVTGSDFRRASALLTETGFAADDAGLAFWWVEFLGERHFQRGRGPVVDLHRRLQQPGTPSPARLEEFLSEATLWKRGDRRLPVLSDQHTCLNAAMTVAKAFLRREPCGGYVCDLRAALDKVGPGQHERVIELAERQGLAGTLAFGLQLVRAVFPAAKMPEMSPSLPNLPDHALTRMAFTPWTPDLSWPRARSVLWGLCARAPAAFGREALWSATSLAAFKGLNRIGRLRRRWLSRPASR